MDFLFSVLAFAVILIPAIIIHELGHFFAAKMVGINVLEFGIGFPPRAMRLFVWGETEFTLNWLPIGGFVRPLGEDMIGPVQEQLPEDFDDEDKAKHTSYITEREELMARGVPREKLLSVNEAKPLPRIWFMAAGAAFNVLSALIFFIITALFGLPTTMGARLMLADIPANSVFAQGEVSRGDAIELVNGEYFATQADFFSIWNSSNSSLELTMRHPDDYENAELAGTRYTINVTPPTNLQLDAYIMINSVLADSPAEAAGLLAGDLVYSINGELINVTDPLDQIYKATEEFAGREVELGLVRNDERFTVSLIPRENPPRNQGRLGVGIQSRWQTSDGIVYENARPQIEYVPQSFDAAVGYGFNRLFMVLKLIWDLPGQLISGAIAPEQARPVSIIGISQLGGQFLQDNIRSRSIWMVLDFIGLISIFLGITNLLPIPPLDGGRILFVLIEVVRGKPVPPHIENLVYRVGMVLLLGLGVIVMIMDVFMPLF
jgi:regulator of sigma E protease